VIIVTKSLRHVKSGKSLLLLEKQALIL